MFFPFVLLVIVLWSAPVPESLLLSFPRVSLSRHDSCPAMLSHVMLLPAMCPSSPFGVLYFVFPPLSVLWFHFFCRDEIFSCTPLPLPSVSTLRLGLASYRGCDCVAHFSLRCVNFNFTATIKSFSPFCLKQVVKMYRTETWSCAVIICHCLPKMYN